MKKPLSDCALVTTCRRPAIGLRRIPSLRDLSREAQAWNRKMNRDRVVINWKFTR
jgi:hypothetical protein